MFRSFAAVAAAFLLSAAPACADAVDDVVRQYMDASHIPGAAVAVVRDGRLEKLQGYGVANLEWNGVVTPDTPFQIASVSKAFTGVVLMRLVERGELSLDDPVSRWLPDTPAAWAPITVRHLAGHTSGLPEGLNLAANATVAEAVAAAKARPLAYEPGTRSQYGLTDFIVLTAVMEKASGLGFPELLEREVVKPLGLKATGFVFMREAGRVRTWELLPGRASTYGWRDGVQREEAFLYPVHTYAGGGLYSSARDLATFIGALESGRLLRPESFRLMTSPVALKDGRPGPFGIGWTVGEYRGEPATGHTGGPALGDLLYLPRKRLAVISLVNQRRFYPLLSKAIADLGAPTPAAVPAIADARPELTQAARETLEAAAAGRLDKARFAPDGEGAFAYLSDFGQALLTAVGPVGSVTPVAERVRDDGQVVRTYRVAFQRRTLPWVARTLPDGKLVELRPDE